MQPISVDQVSGLISDIYDCALQPSLWPDALTKLTRMTSAAYSAISLADIETAAKAKAIFAVWSPWDRDQIVRLYDDFAAEIPHISKVLHGDIDVPFALLSEMPELEFQNSRFYREWVAPQGLRDGCVTKFATAPAKRGVLTVVTAANRDIISPEECRLIGVLSPHIRRSVLIGDLLDRAKIAVANYQATLDSLQSPVFLTDRTGRIDFCNTAAHSLLESRKPARNQNGSVLALAAPAVRPHLADIIAQSAAGNFSALGGRGIGIPLSEPAEPPVAAYVLPLAASDVRSSFGSADVAVFVSIGSTQSAPPETLLRSLFGLTASEAWIMLSIGGGATVAQTGGVLGITENTVKTHLSRIFAKTGTNRQSQLAALLNGLCKP